MRPKEGLRPKLPVKLAGMRIEPPPSVAVTGGQRQPARAADEPPLEPPGVRSGSHGERVVPKTRFLVIAVWPNSGVLVLPTTIAPTASRRSTCVVVCSATLPA